jgi:hypothetical protein
MFVLSSPAQSRADIAAMIKADVAEIVAGINAHDADRTTMMFDAPDVIGMEAFNAPIMGANADKDGVAAAFKESPSWRVGMIDETVDVAEA